MGWLVALAILVLPFVLVRFDRQRAVRIALALFWSACACGGAWFLIQAHKAETDLETVRTYALPDVPGTHRVTITPPSQKSMKAELRGGDGVLSPEALKKLDWRFLERFVPATWFDPKQHDQPDAGSTLLFYVDWGTQDGPLTLEYKVEPETAALLHGRSLVVGHDGSARHMIRDHLLPALKILGWGLIVWGGLWTIVQVVRESMRAKKNASGPAGTEALGFLLFFILYSLFFT